MARLVLRLRVVYLGSTLAEFSREFSTWEELLEEKDRLKSVVGSCWGQVRFDTATKAWELYSPVFPRFVKLAAKELASIFGADSAEIEKALREQLHQALEDVAAFAEGIEDRGDTVVVPAALWDRITGLWGDWRIRELYGELYYYRPTLRGYKRDFKAERLLAYRHDWRTGDVYMAPWLYAALVRPVLRTLGLDSPTAEVEVNDNLEITPYEYQLEALRAWLERDGRGTIVLPTGAGKTWVGILALLETRQRALIVTPSVEVVKQWAEKLENLVDRVGILAEGRKELDADVVVATYASASKLDPETLGRFELLILDEAHRLPAETFKSVAWFSKAYYIVALSATPERGDGNDYLLFRIAGDVVYQRTYEQLAREGYLPKVYLTLVRVTPPPDLAQELAGLHQAKVELMRAIDDWGADTEKGRQYSRQFARVANKQRLLEAKNPRKIDAVVHIVKQWLEKGRGIVFCEYKTQAKELYQRLKNEGVPVALLTGDLSGSKRADAVEGFREGRYKVLVATSAADEGVDLPGSAYVVIVSTNTKELTRKFIQRIGRVTRGSPAVWAYILATWGRESRKLGELAQRLAQYFGTYVLTEDF